jgi:nicotinamide-nucleotide amidase
VNTDTPESAARLVSALAAVGATVATAESLTGGLVGGCVTSVAGASAVYLGGVVSYATDVKTSLLGVPASLVEEYGVVSGECAEAMADGVRRLLGATYGLSTTGVAGPDEQEGKPAGTVYVGVAGPAGVHQVALAFSGDRASIRTQTVAAALSAVSEQLSADGGFGVGDDSGLG